MDEIQTRGMSEVDRFSQRIAGRVKELVERHEVPLPHLALDVYE